MVQVLSTPNSFAPDVNHHVVAFPTRPASHRPTEVPTKPGSHRAAARRVGVRSHITRGVALLEVSGPLGDVVEELDRAIQLALAEGTRGVVCDLSGVLEGAQPSAVKVLATAGRHVRDWSGIPVAVASPNSLLREALAAHPQGRHLLVTDSIFPAVAVVLATPVLKIERLRIAPHPIALRATSPLASCRTGGWASSFSPQNWWSASS